MIEGKSKIGIRAVQIGTVSEIEDCGSVVIVRLKTPNGWSTPVFFDHRQFSHMLESEGCSASSLVGREAQVDGYIFSITK
jgi:hypothetical protein